MNISENNIIKNSVFIVFIESLKAKLDEKSKKEKLPAYIIHRPKTSTEKKLSDKEAYQMALQEMHTAYETRRSH